MLKTQVFLLKKEWDFVSNSLGQPEREYNRIKAGTTNMDNVKPFVKISARFQISQESAKYFLGRVQKSFKTERPSHKLIMEFIDTQDFEFLLTPYEVAAMMKESGVWAHALNTEPPAIVDDEDLV